jgi:capsular polysaccharide biosynthesis protein
MSDLRGGRMFALPYPPLAAVARLAGSDGREGESSRRPAERQSGTCTMINHAIRNFVVNNLPAWTHPALRSLEMSALSATSSVLRHLPGEDTPRRPPRRIVETLQRYAAEQPSMATYTELYPPYLDRRTPPLAPPPAGAEGQAGAAGSLHPVFLGELSRMLPSAGVGVVRHGRVLTSMGAVITPDNRLVNDVSHTGAGENAYAHPLFSKLRLPELRRVAGRVAVITMYPGNIPGHPYYAHWLLDMLPRLHLLEKSGIGWDKLVVPQVVGYQRESLRLLGIEPDKIISEPELHLQADELVVPTLVGSPIGNYPAWACHWLRERFLPLAGAGERPRRLFISRAKAARRRLLNEDELMAALTPLGFERMFLEEHSFIDNVRMLHDAEAVVSPHGANTAIFIFCKRGTPVIELFSPKYVAACHYSAMSQVGLNYGYVLGKGDIKERGHYSSEDITVDPDQVVRLLRRSTEESSGTFTARPEKPGLA